MVDPSNITNYNLTSKQLEEHILFWVFAAGHNANSTAKGLERFLGFINGNKEPFKAIRTVVANKGWSRIQQFLSISGLGCWQKKTRAIKELVEKNLNLKTCSVEDLEGIYCIGPKTARCFILHSRPGVDNIAGLDTHILKYMRDEGIDVPKGSPSGKKYLELEQKFLELAAQSEMSLAEFDLHLWNKYSGN